MIAQPAVHRARRRRRAPHALAVGAARRQRRRPSARARDVGGAVGATARRRTRTRLRSSAARRGGARAVAAATTSASNSAACGGRWTSDSACHCTPSAKCRARSSMRLDHAVGRPRDRRAARVPTPVDGLMVEGVHVELLAAERSRASATRRSIADGVRGAAARPRLAMGDRRRRRDVGQVLVQRAAARDVEQPGSRGRCRGPAGRAPARWRRTRARSGRGRARSARARVRRRRRRATGSRSGPPERHRPVEPRDAADRSAPAPSGGRTTGTPPACSHRRA